MKDIILKKTKKVNTVLGISRDGTSGLLSFQEVLYTDTGKSGKYLFSARVSWKDDENIPDNIIMRLVPKQD